MLVLAGCGNSDSVDDSAAKARADGYPVTIENCGRTVTVNGAPERVVSLNQASTEILLSLGLADRIVGTATLTDPVRANLVAANESVPRLADDKPSLETVLNVEPDFVTPPLSVHQSATGALAGVTSTRNSVSRRTFRPPITDAPVRFRRRPMPTGRG